MDSPNTYAVIMAGGRGERFWPLGRRNVPKQFLKLNGENTLLEETIARLDGLVPPERILVITNVQYVDRTRKLLGRIPPDNIVGEPEGRNTAPCIALAAGLIRRRGAGSDAVMLVLPADHAIRPVDALRLVLRRAAAEAARRDILITFGVTPSFPATGYGYIQCGDALVPGFRKALSFREKPAAAEARRLFDAGNFKWNSGIFVWSVAAIGEAFRQFVPELADFADGCADSADADAWIAEHFPQCPALAIDVAVMEKAANVWVGDTPFAWDDLGSWNALVRYHVQDENGNIADGDVAMVDTENSLVLGEKNRLIGLLGMRDVAVIQAGDATLICPKSKAQQVKMLLEVLKNDPGLEKYL